MPISASSPALARANQLPHRSNPRLTRVGPVRTASPRTARGAGLRALVGDPRDLPCADLGTVAAVERPLVAQGEAAAAELRGVPDERGHERRRLGQAIERQDGPGLVANP